MLLLLLLFKIVWIVDILVWITLITRDGGKIYSGEWVYAYYETMFKWFHSQHLQKYFCVLLIHFNWVPND